MRNEVSTWKDWIPSVPSIRSQSASRLLAAIRKALGGALNQIRRVSNGALSARSSRRLRVVETVSLGEKRFVSILHIDGEEFLLGGSASSLVVLAKLDAAVAAAEPFGSVLLRENQTTGQASRSSSDQTSGSTL
jgi:flagellar biogenesis protein FliO